MANSLHNRLTKHVLPDVSDTAKTAVRLGFNPSADKTVEKTKILAAALITECENIRNNANGHVQSRWAALGITTAEEASMWAVKAATASKEDETGFSEPEPAPGLLQRAAAKVKGVAR